MPQKQMQLNFPGDNPMHPFKRRKGLVKNLKRREIVEEGIGSHPRLLRARLDLKRGEYGKRRSRTLFAHYPIETQQQIHAYHIAKSIVTQNRHAVPKETVYHAVALLRRLSPTIRSMNHQRELLALGEEKRMEFSKLNPKHCNQFVTEIKQLISEQRGKKLKERLRLRDIATFWDPLQREALSHFSRHTSAWMPLAQQLHVMVDHCHQLRGRITGTGIEDYENALTELQNLSDCVKKKMKKKNAIIPTELAQTFLKEYRALKDQLIE